MLAVFLQPIYPNEDRKQNKIVILIGMTEKEEIRVDSQLFFSRALSFAQRHSHNRHQTVLRKKSSLLEGEEEDKTDIQLTQSCALFYQCNSNLLNTFFSHAPFIRGEKEGEEDKQDFFI